MRNLRYAGLVLGAVALCCGLQAIFELRAGGKAAPGSLLQYSLPTTYYMPKDTDLAPKQSAAAKKLALNLKKFQQKQKAKGSSHHVNYPFSYLHDEPELRYPVHPGAQKKGPKAVRTAPQPEIKAMPLPAGYHILKPGQTLPKGAKVVEMEPVAVNPAMTVNPQALRQFAHPVAGRGAQQLDDADAEEAGEEGAEEGEEGGEERVANVTVPEPTIDERIDIAHEQHRLARVEKIRARELAIQAQNLQRDGVMLIDQGWKNHKAAEAKIDEANSRMDTADEMNANANKILELANAHANEELANKMDEISADLEAAAAEKATASKDYQDEADAAQAELDAAAGGEEGGEEGAEEAPAS